MKHPDKLSYLCGQLGRKYDFYAGPDTESPSTNCQEFGQEFSRACFEIELPSSYRSSEIFEDDGKFFRNIDHIRRTKFGDIHIFAGPTCDDPKKYHLAVQVAYLRERGEPLLMHANYVDRSVGIWPLGDFSMCERYSRYIGTRRIIRPYERNGYKNSQD